MVLRSLVLQPPRLHYLERGQTQFNRLDAFAVYPCGHNQRCRIKVVTLAPDAVVHGIALLVVGKYAVQYADDNRAVRELQAEILAFHLSKLLLVCQRLALVFFQPLPLAGNTDFLLVAVVGGLQVGRAYIVGIVYVFAARDKHMDIVRPNANVGNTVVVAHNNPICRPALVKSSGIVEKVSQMCLSTCFHQRLHTAVRQQGFHQFLRGYTAKAAFQPVAAQAGDSRISRIDPAVGNILIYIAVIAQFNIRPRKAVLITAQSSAQTGNRALAGNSAPFLLSSSQVFPLCDIAQSKEKHAAPAFRPALRVRSSIVYP